MALDMKVELAKIRKNINNIERCKKHRFDPDNYGRKPGAKATCLNCGGVMRLTEVGSYLQGFKAAGGDTEEVWPGYYKKRK